MTLKTSLMRFLRPLLFLGVATLLLCRVPMAAAEEVAPEAVAPAATQASTGDNTSGKEAPKLNLWELYKRGGFFMYPLTLCSVLAIALIIERFIGLRRSVAIPPGFLAGLKAAWRDPIDDRDSGIAYCQQHDSSISRMVLAGIKRWPRGVAVAEKAVEDAGANEALKLRRNMRFLYSMGSVATLLGLIGTISGMIKAFQSAAGSGTPDVTKLSTGIYEAMVNTFAGLAIAIVVTTFYYYFAGRIERLITDMNDSLADFADEFGFNAESDKQMQAAASL